MNLGKLLIAGKSIIGGRRQISYHVVEGAYLPKFISPKNPFVAPAKVEPLPQAVATPVKNKVGSDGKKTQKLPPFSTQLRKPTWISRLNPISIWRGSTLPTVPKTLCPRQAELSLDRVKVVHNDLSDADVEVVPIKSRMAPETAEPSHAAANGGDSWSRLGAKIFGVKAA